MKATILIVTMTGTAEMIAEDIQVSQKDHEIGLVLAERTDIGVLQARNLLVVSSTYGSGEVPDPGKPLYEAIKRERPDLSRLRYGVISLGDTIYADSFANGGRLWDALLQDCGGKRLAETLLLDASGEESMSELAVTWALQWTALADEDPALRDVPSAFHADCK